MDIVDKTVARWERDGFEWGVTDCDMSLADYAMEITGQDPAADWRGQYHDQQSAYVFIERAGGNSKLMETGLRSIGIEPVEDAPTRGDIVAARFGSAEIAGLCLGRFVAFRRPTRGVLRTQRAEITKVWRCSKD